MHSKRLLVGLALALLALAAAPALAQGGWFAYVYNSLTGDLVRVDAAGAQQVYNLGLSANTYVSGFDMAFTPDGSRVAFCAFEIMPDSAQGAATLYVRDIAAGTNLLSLNLGGAIGCRVTRSAWDESLTQVAVSVVRYYPGDPQADASVPAWDLSVVDVASGSVVSRLDAAAPAVAAAGIFTGAAIMPEVRRFSGGEIVFVEIPWGVGGGAEYPAWVWQPAAGALTPEPTGIWGKSSLRWLPAADELVWLDADPSLSAVQQDGPVPPYNVVMVARGEQAGLLLHSADRTPVDMAYINGGAQLAVLLLPPADFAAAGSQPGDWVALDRAGGQTPLRPAPQYSALADAPGGYAIFELVYGSDLSAPQAALTLVSGGAARLLWSAGDQGWELAWAAPVPASADLPPFPVTAP